MKNACTLIAFISAVFLLSACAKETATVSGAPEFSMTMAELRKASTDTTAHAHDLYKGKVMEITGKIESVDRPFEDEVVVRLTDPESQYHAEARLNDEAAAAAQNLQAGQEVKLVCKCTGIEMLAQFQDCRIEQ